MPSAGARVGFQAAGHAGGAKAGEKKKGGGPGCMPNAGARVGFQAAEHAGGVYERERCSGKEKVAEPAACPTPVPGSASRQLSIQPATM